MRDKRNVIIQALKKKIAIEGKEDVLVRLNLMANDSESIDEFGAPSELEQQIDLIFVAFNNDFPSNDCDLIEMYLNWMEKEFPDGSPCSAA